MSRLIDDHRAPADRVHDEPLPGGDMFKLERID
jgi:hypothetical protein